MMGGSLAHEFMVLNPAGEDVLVLCDSCGFSANRQVAAIRAPAVAEAAQLPMEEIETPGTTTIADAGRVPRDRSAPARPRPPSSWPATAA